MELKIKTTKIFNDINSDYRIIILRGGTRSSKTYSAVQWLVVQALSNPGIVCSIVRKSFPSIRISVLRDFKEIMNNLGLWNDDLYKYTENVYTFENGSKIEFISIGDAERRKGTKRDYLLIDEANELTYDEFFQLFIRCTSKTILSFNPSFSTQHWIYTNVIHHPEAKEFVSTYKDNPFLDKELVLEIERLKDISPSYYKIYGEGTFGVIEGLIFDNFTIVDNIPDLSELTLLGYGLDFGFSNDPTALVGCFKYEDNILLVELLYQKGLLSNQIASKIREYYDIYGKKQVIADSSDGRLIKEISMYGVIIEGVKKGAGSIQSGIDIMKQQKILIPKSSINLVNEFYNYLYKKDKNGTVMNEPVDNNNHLIDGSRYIMSTYLGNKGKNYGTYSFSIK